MVKKTVNGPERPDTAAEVEAYLTNDDNRRAAFERAMQLLHALDPRMDMMHAGEKTYTRTEITRRTTISHRQATELLETLRAFGYVTILDKNVTRFAFSFTASDRLTLMKTKLIAYVERAGKELEAYRTLLAAEFPDQLEKEMTGFQSFTEQVLRFK